MEIGYEVKNGYGILLKDSEMENGKWRIDVTRILVYSYSMIWKFRNL